MSSEVEAVERMKVMYEQLDTLYGALPEIHREEFIDVIKKLNASAVDNSTWRSVFRWLKQHNA